MERVNVVVLASLVAALALFGLRLFSPAAAPDLTAGAADAGRSAFGPAGVRDRKLPPARIAMYGGGRENRQPPPEVPPPAEERRRGSRGGSITGGGSSAELIAGVERRRAMLEAGPGRSFGASNLPTVELSDTLLAGRTGAVPPLRASGRDLDLPEADPNQRRTLEFDDGPRKGGGDDVLLKLPFKGDINAEVGGGPIQVEGLVTQGGQVEFPAGAQLVYPAAGNVNSDAGTIAFEMQPKWAGADATDNSLVQIRNEHTWENTLSIVKNLNSLRYIIIDSAGVERNVNIPIDDWAAGEPRQVTATWDGDSMALYVDGQQVGENTLPHPLDFSTSTPIHIGSDFPGGSYVGAGGTIADFTIYGRALGADEISTR